MIQKAKARQFYFSNFRALFSHSLMNSTNRPSATAQFSQNRKDFYKTKVCVCLARMAAGARSCKEESNFDSKFSYFDKHGFLIITSTARIENRVLYGLRGRGNLMKLQFQVKVYVRVHVFCFIMYAEKEM